MKTSSIVVIIYIVGIIIGALFLDIWGGETNMKKSLLAHRYIEIFLLQNLKAPGILLMA